MTAMQKRNKEQEWRKCRRFYPLAEELHHLIAQYYGNVQVLSIRNVLYHTILAHPDQRDLDIYRDSIHLQTLGHILYADVVIHFLRQSLIHARAEARAFSAVWEQSHELREMNLPPNLRQPS
ncbi:hypothetical protein CEUSTIGMA_g4306.t1 [Chlamydomonas eustigma]|uniref:Uncharacterized protein n=1 Tax=Chlamydomonas eustigma TaxID=1157962 RepID=A0A250X289_9CHLO|nr:hypothetical protein CEUSTIGMA_g4306.t1 [Chlamydomonas eustigma]|eukprot:GAX76860.1 hypothetical protein CEUSTIGMA_g4306.t1 [Chlamydomonas eustigma]